MPNYKKDKEGKQVNSEIDIFLATELGILSSLKGKSIRFNPNPFKKPDRLSNDRDKNLSFVDFHLDIVKKVDALLEDRENELKTDPVEVEFVSQKQNVLSLRDILEEREPFNKRPAKPVFRTELNSVDVFGSFDPKQDLFEVELPTGLHSDLRFVGNFEELCDASNVTNVENSPQIWAVDNKESSRWLMGLGKIKVRSKKDIKNDKKIAKEKKKKLREKQKERELKEQEKLKQIQLKETAKLEAEKQKLIEKENLEKEKQKKLEAKREIEEEKIKKEGSEEKASDKKDVKAKQVFGGLFKKKKESKKKEEKTTPAVEQPKVENKPVVKEEDFVLDEEVSNAITIIDELLEQLPDKVIDEFVQSDDFALYEKVVKKYKK